MRFELTILGSSGTMPFRDRFPTAQVLNVREQLFLIDAGEGVQMRMSRFRIRRGKIKRIFTSHLHGDHIFGLPGLLTSLGMNYRQDPLHIYSPPGLKKMIDGMFPETEKAPPFPIHYHEVDPSLHQLIWENRDLTVHSIPLRHGIPCCGYLFREKKMPRKMRRDKIQEYSIPFDDIPAIKAGGDWKPPKGEIIPNEELTLDSPAPRAYAFCSDTAYTEEIIPIIKEVNLLYHEATFLHEDREKAALTNHSTALQAATIAKAAEVGRLIMGHYSARYEDLGHHLAEASEIFPASSLGYDGLVLAVPPTLHDA
jgi:ribonuclease Z